MKGDQMISALKKWRKQRDAKRLNKLLEQAAMNIYAYNTGVVLSTDGVGRVLVSSAFYGADWSDCLQIAFNHVNDEKRQWFFFHLSAARARVLAHNLLKKADQLESANKCIDKSVG